MPIEIVTVKQRYLMVLFFEQTNMKVAFLPLSGKKSVPARIGTDGNPAIVKFVTLTLGVAKIVE